MSVSTICAGCWSSTCATTTQPGRIVPSASSRRLKLVGLGECGTHAIVAARLGTSRANERELAEDLVSDFEPGMLIIADRGFTVTVCGRRP